MRSFFSIPDLKRTSNACSRGAGYTLVEVLFAVLFVGLLLVPLLAYVARLPEFNHQVGEKSRREAWVSFQDQALVSGVDPSLAPALLQGSNTAIPAVSPSLVLRGAVLPVVGIPTLRSLRAPAEAGSSRMGASGWEISAGEAAPFPEPPATPLLPTTLKAPIVVPADSTRIPLSSLVAASPGQPYVTLIRASSSEYAKIVLILDGLAGTGVGLGQAERTVDAVRLAQGVSGVAWAEYPGDALAGNLPTSLSDGRTRWSYVDLEGRNRVVEPSAVVRFNFVLDMGSPVLVDGATEYVSGSAISFEYSAYLSLRAGLRTLRIQWPASTLVAFGSQATQIQQGFNWSFQGQAGSALGNLQEFTTQELLSLWEASNTVIATGIVLSGTTGIQASWTLNRVTTELQSPELVSSPSENQTTYDSGVFGFSVPAQPDGNRLGRISARAGSLLSSGPTLNLQLEP